MQIDNPFRCFLKIVAPSYVTSRIIPRYYNITIIIIIIFFENYFRIFDARGTYGIEISNRLLIIWETNTIAATCDFTNYRNKYHRMGSARPAVMDRSVQFVGKLYSRVYNIQSTTFTGGYKVVGMKTVTVVYRWRLLFEFNIMYIPIYTILLIVSIRT